VFGAGASSFGSVVHAGRGFCRLGQRQEDDVVGRVDPAAGSKFGSSPRSRKSSAGIDSSIRRPRQSRMTPCAPWRVRRGPRKGGDGFEVNFDVAELIWARLA
jgi:hypothetical protein